MEQLKIALERYRQGQERKKEEERLIAIKSKEILVTTQSIMVEIARDVVRDTKFQVENQKPHSFMIVVEEEHIPKASMSVEFDINELFYPNYGINSVEEHITDCKLLIARSHKTRNLTAPFQYLTQEWSCKKILEGDFSYYVEIMNNLNNQLKKLMENIDSLDHENINRRMLKAHNELKAYNSEIEQKKFSLESLKATFLDEAKKITNLKFVFDYEKLVTPQTDDQKQLFQLITGVRLLPFSRLRTLCDLDVEDKELKYLKLDASTNIRLETNEFEVIRWHKINIKVRFKGRTTTSMISKQYFFLILYYMSEDFYNVINPISN